MNRASELNPVTQTREERMQDIKKCFDELKGYESEKLKLTLPVFFVPGWTGEDCSAWKMPEEKETGVDKEYFLPVKYWIDRIIENHKEAHFVTFTDREKTDSFSFVDFGNHLRKKIKRRSTGSKVNLVGHSMGGLNIRAAVVNSEPEELSVNNVIAFGSPNRGNNPGSWIAGRYSENHRQQLINMHSSCKAMKSINNPDAMKKFFKSINRYYPFMGGRDYVVGRSLLFKLKDDFIYKNKVMLPLEFTSARHTGAGSITRDPRAILALIKILCGKPLKNSPKNFGYIYKV